MRWCRAKCQPTRISWCRLLFCVLCISGGLALLVNIQHKVSMRTRHAPHDPGGGVLKGNKEKCIQHAEGTIKEEENLELREEDEESDELTTVDVYVNNNRHGDDVDVVIVPPTHNSPMDLNRSSPLDPTNLHIPSESGRPWYMIGGQLQPTGPNISIFPEELGEDRIPDQLMYLPPIGSYQDQSDPDTPLKKILLWNGASSWTGLQPGRGVFLKDKCPVSTCVLSTKKTEADTADLVMFKDHFTLPSFKRPPTQYWMIYLLECPLHTQIFKQSSLFNWTATYRSDSTLVTPYERWQLYNENVRTFPQEINYAANKTKQVAWFVSNCGARNGRLNYARALAKYISVDIYGACGKKRCSRSSSKKCFNMLDTDYKFYLAFENSNCQDYITEKFFVNGLSHNILPIVMGARPEDYKRSAPYHSYIHVDEFSGPKQLAEFLLKLDEDDDLYNEYFQWKGTGEFINTKFWCRVCSLLHNTKDRSVSNYYDINKWWRGEGVCSNKGWREESDTE